MSAVIGNEPDGIPEIAPNRVSSGAQSVKFVSLNYSPEETGIGPYSSRIAAKLQSEGFTVDSIAGMPHYPQWEIWPEYRDRSPDAVDYIDGVRVSRVSHPLPRNQSVLARSLFELVFAYRVIRRLGNSRTPVIAVSPSLIAAFAISLRQQLLGLPFGLIVQDLYGQAASELHSKHYFYRVLAKTISYLERSTFSRSNKIVVVGPRMMRAVAKARKSPEVCLIQNWAHIDATNIDEHLVAEIRRQLHAAQDDILAIHTGNMGAKQNLENIVHAAALADAENLPIKFALVGDGLKRDAVETLAQSVPNLTVLDPVPSEQYPSLLQAADVLLLNELPGVKEMCVPSKLTSYFASKRPIVAAVNSNGAASDLLLFSVSAEVVKPGDPRAMVNAIQKAGGLSSDLRPTAPAIIPDENSALQMYVNWATDLCES